MKFTTTFLALFATVAASTFSSQVDARIGGDRNLNSNDGPPDGPHDGPHDGPDKKYTVYFANSCDKRVGVMANGDSDNISPNTCQAFNGGKQYPDSFTYKESGSGIAGGNVSCKNIGSSNNDKCNLLGMPRNACVITIDLCGEPAPTRSPTRAPTSAPIREPKCKRHCNKGKPCGDSCIADNATCTKSRGTACWVKEKCTKFCDAGQACGNSCISKKNTCSKTPDEGFACNTEDY